MHHPTDRIAHTTTFVTPVVEHWLEREIAQWVHPMKDRSDNPNTLTTELRPTPFPDEDSTYHTELVYAHCLVGLSGQNLVTQVNWGVILDITG